MDLKFLDSAKEFFNKNADPALATAWTATWIVAAMKGTQIKLYETKKSSQFADYILVGTFSNPTQANAISQQVIKTLKQFEVNLRAFEGYNDSDWLLIDMFDVIVHLFSESARQLYALDELLAAYRPVAIPQEFYTASNDSILEELEITKKSTEDFKNYF
ncbi:MAG: ribosome silencing factor [Bacteriovoracaceae bacterium]|nr:ribosome silencing factor [Bacteriovoracaceae bacterium]